MASEDRTPTEFELQVAQLYRLSGASVEHNKNVGGNQVDVWVVERTPAGTDLRLVVECKDYKSRPVGIEAVNKLATKINLLRSSNLADVGVLVSSSGFSQEARLGAESQPLRLSALEDLQQAVQEPARIVVQDVTRAVEQARRLSEAIKEALRAPDRLTSFDLDGLHADITKVLREYRTIIDRHRSMRPANSEARRNLGSVVRLEEATDQTLDALYYFRRVDEAIAEATVGLPPAGRTEADFAAATSTRMRDLEQARAQLRFRLKRLEETCDRLVLD